MVVLVLFLVGCNKEETKKETDVAKETQPATETKTEEKTTEVSTETSEASEQTKETAETTSTPDDADAEKVKESDASTSQESIDENATTEVKAEEKTPGCTDSDNGKDYNVMGTVTLKTGYKESDGCSTNANTPNKLYEKYCKGDVYLTEGYECEYGCSAGACVAGNDETSDEATEVSNETTETVPDQPTNSTQ